MVPIQTLTTAKSPKTTKSYFFQKNNSERAVECPEHRWIVSQVREWREFEHLTELPCLEVGQLTLGKFLVSTSNFAWPFKLKNCYNRTRMFLCAGLGVHR